MTEEQEQDGQTAWERRRRRNGNREVSSHKTQRTQPGSTNGALDSLAAGGCVGGALDSPNHVDSSLLLEPNRRRAVGESHL